MATSKEQDIELGINRIESGSAGRAQHAVLQIHTGKHYNGGLSSTANVFWLSPGSRQTLMGWGSGGDYDKRVYVSGKVTATQKAIDTQHARVFTPEVIAGLVAEAQAHYAGYIAAGVDGMHNTYPKP